MANSIHEDLVFWLQAVVQRIDTDPCVGLPKWTLAFKAIIEIEAQDLFMMYPLELSEIRESLARLRRPYTERCVRYIDDFNVRLATSAVMADLAMKALVKGSGR
jgi:hypothetical protein